MKKYATEFIGTFFLVLTVGQVVIAGTLLAGIAIGTVLMVMVYMGGHVSGAHYNPAVSLAAWMGGKMGLREAVVYMISQAAGGLVAALATWFLLDATWAPAPAAEPMQALLAEFLFTFALVLVIMNVAMSDKTAGNSYFGLAIGFTVLAGVYAVGDVSGAAFNPAVGIGPVVVNALGGDGSFGDLWLYLLGPFLGGAAAVPVFKLQHG